MAAPTRTELETRWQNSTHILEETRKFAADNAENFIGLEDTFIQNLEGDRSPEAAAGIRALRDQLSGFLANGRVIMDPLFADWGKFVDASEDDIETILGRLFDDMVDNGRTVQSRGFTFGSPAAGGGNIGDGALLRLNKDEDDFDIENQTPDTAKAAECVTDANSGVTRNQEVFEIRGGFGGIDALDVEGVGDKSTIVSADSHISLHPNPSFDVLSGDSITVIDDIPDWDVQDIAGAALVVAAADFELSEADVFLPAPDGNTTVRALNIKRTTGMRLSQTLVDQGIALSPGQPYYLSLAFNREVGGATGTLRLRLGSQEVSVVLAAQTGYNILQLPLDTNSWFKNFNTEGLDIRITLDAGSTGELLIDDVTLLPLSFFDGGWYLLRPGQTPFLREDIFTWSDTATESIIQRWAWLLHGAYFPHSGTPNITDP